MRKPASEAPGRPGRSRRIDQKAERIHRCDKLYIGWGGEEDTERRAVRSRTARVAAFLEVDVDAEFTDQLAVELDMAEVDEVAKLVDHSVPGPNLVHEYAPIQPRAAFQHQASLGINENGTSETSNARARAV